MIKTEARKTKKSTKIYIDIEIHIITYTELSFLKKSHDVHAKKLQCKENRKERMPWLNITSQRTSKDTIVLVFC